MKPDRRTFLKWSISGTTLFAAGSLLDVGEGRAADALELLSKAHDTSGQSLFVAPQREFALHVREGFRRMVDGRSVYAWGYTDESGLIQGVGPPLTVREGERIKVTLVNEARDGHNLYVKDILSDQTVVPPGGRHTYEFMAPPAGTYLYYDSVNDPLARAMGLCGALVALPADGSQTAWTGGPAFDQQFRWVLSELDERWNAARQNGQPVNLRAYRPNYFFINGRSFPETMSDSNAMMSGRVGQTILIRTVNGGLISHAMHFHGYHFRIIARNGQPQAAFIEKDTFVVYPGETVDVLVTLDQPGRYPVHDHSLMALTANGVYPNGIMAEFDVRGA